MHTAILLFPCYHTCRQYYKRAHRLFSSWQGVPISLLQPFHHIPSLYQSNTTHFFVKKIPTPKPWSFPILNSFYSIAFQLTTLIGFPLNLISSTQQMSTERSNISSISPDLPLRVPTFTMQTSKSPNLLSSWCSCWMMVSVCLILLCTTSSLKVPVLFVQFNLSIYVIRTIKPKV